MSLFSQIGVLALSLAGILCGVALSYIAPEELADGKKYFTWLKRVLWVILLGITGYSLVLIQNYTLLTIGVILFVGLLVLDFIKENIVSDTNHHTKCHLLLGEDILSCIKIYVFEYKYNYLFNYVLLIATYFLLPSNQLLFASVIFLYGFPSGTLLRMEIAPI